MSVRCPICKDKLIKDQGCYRCHKGHSFDISKEGYLNLLVKQGQKEYGDTFEMISARSVFLNKDYYRPLGDKLIQVISDLKIKTMVDSGCGEGYYTDLIKKALPEIDIVGIDIAKRAIKCASKVNSDNFYIVAGNQDIPLTNECTELVLNCFAPIDHQEYKRILRKSGLLITITPGAEHLLQLKQVLYDHVYLNMEKEGIAGFKEINKEVLEYDIELHGQKDILALFMMTPYYFRTSLEGKERLARLDSLKTHVAFVISVYQAI